MIAKELFSLVREALESEVRDCVALELTKLGENPPEWIRQLIAQQIESYRTNCAVERRLNEARGPAMHVEAERLTRESAARILVELKKFYARQDVALEFVLLREQSIPYPLDKQVKIDFETGPPVLQGDETLPPGTKVYFRNWARVRTSVPVRQIDQIFLVAPGLTGSAKMVPRPLVRMVASAFEPHCLATAGANPAVWTEVAGRDDTILVGPLPSPNYEFTLEYKEKERPRGEED